MSWDAETDILVIGGGGGGLVAAVAAREAGASVALVEKEPRLGGNTALSSGSVPGAGTRFQREAGVIDSPELMARDLMRRTNRTAPHHLVYLLATESGPLVEWLVDSIGAPLRFVHDLKKVGHSVPRTHSPPGRDGGALLQALERAANGCDVLMIPGNPARELVCDDAGNVIGAVLQPAGSGNCDRIRARKVILACNGFAGNREMLREFIPGVMEAPYFGHPGNTGDGIAWGIKLGARLRNMGAYQGHASVSYPHGSLVTWTAIERGGLLVNLRGRRFVDESLGYSGCAAYVLEQPERTAFVVIDERIRRYLTELVPDFRALSEHGGVKTDDTVRNLAASFAIDSAVLAETLDAFDAAARGEIADPLGRTEFGLAPLRPPISMIRVTSGLFHTQGGLDVDVNAQPVRQDGEPIGNLYAVGGVAVGVSGADGGRGYCSANGLLAALGLGRVAGRHAAAAL